MYTLYRDDDISVTSNIDLLMRVHELFLRYNKIHTVAVLMKDLWENKEVWYWLMTAKNLKIGLHGWNHHDYGKLSSMVIQHDIQKCVDYWVNKVSKGNYSPPNIDVFYPPWNSTSPILLKVLKHEGFQVDSRVGPPVYNFHYWACIDEAHIKSLEEALKS